MRLALNSASNPRDLAKKNEEESDRFTRSSIKKIKDAQIRLEQEGRLAAEYSPKRKKKGGDVA
jgi:hypothetical protein